MASFPDSCIAIAREISAGWKNRLIGTSWSSVKRSTKFCIWRGIITGTSTSWELTDKKPPLQNGIWGVLLGTKLTMNQHGHRHSWLPEGDCSNRNRRSSFLHTQTGETHLEFWIQFWTPEYRRDMEMKSQRSFGGTRCLSWWESWDCSGWRKAIIAKIVKHLYRFPGKVVGSSGHRNYLLIHDEMCLTKR